MGSTRVPRASQASRSRLGSSPEATRVGRLSVDGLGLHDHKKRGLPFAAKIAIAVAAVLVVAVVGILAVSRMPVLQVENVSVEATDHLSSDEIVRLAAVPEDATLLNVDVNQIQENLAKNPWVKNVTVERVFPDTLKLTVTERTVFALVATGTSVWYLSQEGYWIQPASVTTTGDQTTADAALALAAKEGCLLIQGVPSSVQPKAATKTTDEAVLAVISYQDAFSEGFASQVVSYTAQSAASISCVLKSGLEISLGSPSQIASKEAVVTQLMAEYPNQLTYINVRNPSKPSYRKVDSDSVGEGTGVVTADGTTDDTDSADTSSTADTETSSDASSTEGTE